MLLLLYASLAFSNVKSSFLYESSSYALSVHFESSGNAFDTAVFLCAFLCRFLVFLFLKTSDVFSLFFSWFRTWLTRLAAIAHVPSWLVDWSRGYIHQWKWMLIGWNLGARLLRILTFFTHMFTNICLEYAFSDGIKTIILFLFFKVNAPNYFILTGYQFVIRATFKLHNKETLNSMEPTCYNRLELVCVGCK